MQEKTVINLGRIALEEIAEKPLKIKELLIAKLNENLEKIRLMISGYFFLERKRIYNLTIDEESVSMNEAGNGTFRVNFTIGILDGCADIDRSQLDDMLVSISTNLQTGEILLLGENIPERQPDDF